MACNLRLEVLTHIWGPLAVISALVWARAHLVALSALVIDDNVPIAVVMQSIKAHGHFASLSQ